MAKRVRITNESLNSYGTRVLTAGMNIKQYEKNPVLLYMHQRGNVIGYVKDLKVEGDAITGELMFDEATELSRQCKKQYEFGSLKMVSVGIDVGELSDAADMLADGQTRPTITKSKLFEVSLVDVGANDDAIVMKYEGRTIELGRDGENCLPLINKNINNNQKQKEMDVKEIALKLGLPETATEAEINGKLSALNAQAAQVAQLQKQQEAMTLAAIVQTVEVAMKEKRIGEERKEQFVKLGKSIGVEELQKVLEAMAPQVKLSQMIVNTAEGQAPQGTASYKKLSEVPEEELMAMREKDPKKYAQLYKAEYGMECEL